MISTFLQPVTNLPSLCEDRIGFFTPDIVVSSVNLFYSVWSGFLKDSFTWFPVLMQEVFEGNTPFKCHCFP